MDVKIEFILNEIIKMVILRVICIDGLLVKCLKFLFNYVGDIYYFIFNEFIFLCKYFDVLIIYIRLMFWLCILNLDGYYL